MTIRTCASTAVCTDLWHSFLGIYLLTIPRHGVTHLDRIRAAALTHAAPACVLLCLAKVLVFAPLQPEADPVPVACIGGELLPRQELSMARLWRGEHLQARPCPARLTVRSQTRTGGPDALRRFSFACAPIH